MLALAASLPLAYTNEYFETQWAAYKARFNKVYDEAEEPRRLQIFIDNLKAATVENTKQGADTHGMTKFADLSPEEFKARFLRRLAPVNASAPFTAFDPSACTSCVRFPAMRELLASPPTDFDWTTQGAVTPVKDQGQCGSCWSFGTTGDVEGTHFLAGNDLVSLSEQQLVSCDRIDEGCNGGLQEDAFKYVIKNGLTTEKNYPYTAGHGRAGSCDSSKTTPVAASISSWVQVSKSGVGKTPDEDAIQTALLASGPITIGINASPMQLYRKGIDNPSRCSAAALDHAVLIVGYGVENGQKYWKIKNSWATDWGEDGYYRIVRGTNMCGVASDAVHSVV